jgi:lambda family phage tail tape measure protein
MLDAENAAKQAVETRNKLIAPEPQKPFELIKEPDKKVVEANKKNEADRLKAIADIKKEVEQLTAIYKPYESAINKIHESEVKLVAARNAGTISIQEYKDAMAGLREVELQLNQQRLSDSTVWSDGWNRAYKEYAENSKDAASNAANVFAKATSGMEDAIVGFAKTGKFEFKALVDNILEEMLRIQIRKTLSSAFGGASTGSDFFAGFFANGGNIPAGQVGIVGEAGPEFISGPATITPFKDAPGGATGNVTYNINAVDARSFQEMVAQDPGFIFAVTEQGRKSFRGSY